MPDRSDAVPAVPSGESPAYVALPQSLAECHAMIEMQAALLLDLQAQVAVLQERVKLDSQTSSKPPSSDGPGRPNRAQRRASGRKRGAQFGHKGTSRAMVDESQVDQFIDCPPASVCECGGTVVVSSAAPQRHQVFDVPMVRAHVDEYRLYGGRCQGCGKVHAGELPVGVPRGQLGPKVLSLIGLLGTRFHLSQRKIRHLLDQVLGVNFSVGAISQGQGKVAEALKAPVAEARDSLPTAQAVWMDETHHKREGGSYWAWAVVQPKLAIFAIYPSRARYVIDDLLGKDCTATVTTDRYAAYGHLGVERRQICWAHLVRDVQRIAQRPGLAGRLGARLLGLSLVMFRQRDRGQLHGRTLEGLQRRMHAALTRAANQPHCKRTARTCANLLKLWPALWTFTTDPALAPTNNAAEQALRSLVLKRKISGPTRSLRGDQFIARGFTAHETCLRQGRNLWTFLHQTVQAWIGGTPAPSLLPQTETPVPTG